MEEERWIRTRDVGGDGDFVERFEADDGGYADAVLSALSSQRPGRENLQSTKAKDEHETYLLLLRQLKCSQERHRDGKDHDISRDIQGCIGKPEGKTVHALPLQSLVPERLGGDTHEERAEECPAAIDDQDAHHDLTETHDLLGSEDAHILEDDGDFGEGQSEVVHGDGDP